MNKRFLRLVEEHNPEMSKYQLVLRGAEGDIDAVSISGTEHAYDMFDNIKRIIALGENIEVPEEDAENGLLTPDQQKALDTATALVKDPRRRSFQADPRKDLERTLGDMYKKISTRVQSIAQTIR